MIVIIAKSRVGFASPMAQDGSVSCVHILIAQKPFSVKDSVRNMEIANMSVVNALTINAIIALSMVGSVSSMAQNAS